MSEQVINEEVFGVNLRDNQEEDYQAILTLGGIDSVYKHLTPDFVLNGNSEMNWTVLVTKLSYGGYSNVLEPPTNFTILLNANIIGIDNNTYTALIDDLLTQGECSITFNSLYT